MISYSPFFAQLSSISHEKLSQYYFTCNPKTGPQLQEKEKSLPICRALSILFAKTSYDFVANIEHITSYMEKNWTLITSTKKCIAACHALSVMAHNILHKQKRDSSALIVNLTIASLELLSKKADQKQMGMLEFACKIQATNIVEFLLEQGANIAALSEERKRWLFALMIEKKNYEKAKEFLIYNIDLQSHRHLLKPFLHYLIQNNDEHNALMLIEAGVDRGALNKNGHDTVLFHAVQRGFLPIVKKLYTLGESLFGCDDKQNTLLHIACKTKQYEIAKWLSEKIDVTLKDMYGKSAYYYCQTQLQQLSKHEQLFLLDEGNTFVEYLQQLDEKDVIQIINTLSLLYPASKVHHFIYKVDASHYKNELFIAVPDTCAPNANIFQLLDLFDKVNFTRPQEAHYINPADLKADTGTKKIPHLRKNLEDFLYKVQRRTPYLGTPSQGTTLENFYKTIECCITHTIHTIEHTPESSEKRALLTKTVVEFVRAAAWCGGKIYTNACQQYVSVALGKPPSFSQEILQILGNYRELLMQSCVPDGSHSVHDYNYLMRHLGREFGIPGAEIMENFEDKYIGNGVNITLARTRLKELYSPKNILFECIIPAIEQSGELRGQFFDWCQNNIPEDWKKDYFAEILKHAQSLSSFEEMEDYLDEKDIGITSKQTIEEALIEARKALYISSEVIVDMSAQKIELQPTSVARMLYQLGIFTPIYPTTFLALAVQKVQRFGNALSSYFF